MFMRVQLQEPDNSNIALVTIKANLIKKHVYGYEDFGSTCFSYWSQLDAYKSDSL